MAAFLFSVLFFCCLAVFVMAGGAIALPALLAIGMVFGMVWLLGAIIVGILRLISWIVFGFIALTVGLLGMIFALLVGGSVVVGFIMMVAPILLPVLLLGVLIGYLMRPQKAADLPDSAPSST